MIDLHVHSKASDGLLTPGQVVELARKKGLNAVALTDHDTIEGLPEALAEGERLGVTVIGGVEISLDFTSVGCGKGNMHLLVYFPQPGGAIDQQLEKLKHWRRQRIGLMIEKLNTLGIRLSLQEVDAEATGGQIGRPHLARVMLKKGYVASLEEAFNKYLRRGSAAYVEKKHLTMEQALELCAREPVVPVLAHPYSLFLDGSDLVSLLTLMKSLGLKGVEIVYPEHDLDFRKRLSQIADELGLVKTGGTDFHGDKVEVELGTGRNGNVLVEDSVLENLMRARP